MKVKQLLLTSSLLFTFALQSTAQYCAPNYFFGCGLGDRINHFVVNGDNSSVISTINSGCGTNNYEDFTGANVTFSTGASYNVTINSGTLYDHVQVFIDFNNDQTFQTTETVGGMDSVAMQPATSTFTLSIPSGVTLGGHRMRVVLNGDFMYPNISPCPDQTYGAGEVHDYTAIIQQGCDTPTSLAATAVTFDGTTLTWAIVVGAQGYMYGVTTNSTPPTTGTYTTTLSGPVTGLMSSTPYWGWVRTVCGVGDSSSWVSVQFTTSLCPAPTGVTETAITANSATVSWTAVPGAQGYQYAVNTSMTPPSTGTYTTNSSIPVTGLTPMTVYHTWVRTVCGVGDTSGWNPMHMFTTLPVSVANVSGSSDLLLEAYPNPAKNLVTVSAIGKGNAVATIQLTDITGKLVKSYELTAEQMNIDISAVSPGVYFIRYTDGQHRQTLKVIKE